jgi:TPR repeat protein
VSPRVRHLGAVLLAVLSAAMPSVALAQKAPPTGSRAPKAADGGDDTARARSLFDAGARAYESGQFEAAIQAFEQAYAISPREGLLFSLAQAHRKQHAVTRDPQNLRAAVDHYRKYLAQVKEGARRKDAAEALEQLEPQLASTGGGTAVAPSTKRATIVQISSNTQSATVALDDAPPAPAPLTRQVSPGVHKVRISAPGYYDDEQTIEALEGQFLPFSYPLRARLAKLVLTGEDGADVSVDGRYVGTTPLVAPLELEAGRHFISAADNGHRPFSAQIVAGRGDTQTLDVEMESTGQRTAAWIVMISGVTIAASGAAFGVIALAREGDAEDVLDRAATEQVPPSDVVAYESARVDRDGFAIASVATLAGGGIVTLVGVGLYLFDEPAPVAPPADSGPRSPSTDAPLGAPLELGFTPLVSPEIAGGLVRGRF